ncbi:MAG: BamA/TamA family outer membrane protein [bacterium]|nr:BamA/TamA family outer membrane protein [bacterium]
MRLKGPILKRFILFLPVILCFIIAGSSFAQTKNLREIRRAAEDKYLSDSSKKTERRSGDYVQRTGDTIDADLVVTDGNVEINGMIRGTIIVIDGDLEVGRRGEIRGDAIVISGNIIRRTGAVIVGDEIQTSWRSLVRRGPRVEIRSRYRDRSTRRDWDFGDFDFYDETGIDEDFMFRYNRVEGLFLGARLRNDRWYDSDFLLNVYGEVGYGFKSDDWRYLAGIERNFFYDNGFTFGFKVYDLTDTDDEWRIFEDENTLGAILLKEDHRDYYRRQGYALYFEQRIEDMVKINLEYRTDMHENMRNETNWALFGGDKKFRLNPLITEGDMNSIYAKITLDTRNYYRSRKQGWIVNLSGEMANPDFGDDMDFDFERYIFEVRRYQPLSRFENLNLRLMAGTSRNALPLQRGFYLGGISTLRAFDFKEFHGNSMLLGNVEYIFDPSRVLVGPPNWFLEDFNMILFFDVGAVASYDMDDFSEFFKKENSDLFKHNVGVGLTTHDDGFRVNFAWRTDQKSNDVMVTFRLKHAF